MGGLRRMIGPWSGMKQNYLLLDTLEKMFVEARAGTADGLGKVRSGSGLAFSFHG